MKEAAIVNRYSLLFYLKNMFSTAIFRATGIDRVLL